MKLNALGLMSIACLLLSVNVSNAEIKKPENGVHEENPMQEGDKPQVRGLMNIKEDTQSDIHAFPAEKNPAFKQGSDQKQLMKNEKTKQDN